MCFTLFYYGTIGFCFPHFLVLFVLSLHVSRDQSFPHSKSLIKRFQVCTWKVDIPDTPFFVYSFLGGFKYFFIFTLLGEDSHFDEHISSNGWFNHHLRFLFQPKKRRDFASSRV